MSRRAWTLRTAALMGAGAYGVHQLRFALSPAHGAAVRDHGYLTPVGSVLVGLLLFAFASVLARVARGSVEQAPRLRRVWAGASLSLVAVYWVQESIEALLTRGDIHAAFSHGGWVALPLALGIGLAIALVARGVARASEMAAAERPATAIALPLEPSEAVLEPWSAPRRRVSARHLAPRGPPVASV